MPCLYVSSSVEHCSIEVVAKPPGLRSSRMSSTHTRPLDHNASGWPILTRIVNDLSEELHRYCFGVVSDAFVICSCVHDLVDVKISNDASKVPVGDGGFPNSFPWLRKPLHGLVAAFVRGVPSDKYSLASTRKDHLQYQRAALSYETRFWVPSLAALAAF